MNAIWVVFLIAAVILSVIKLTSKMNPHFYGMGMLGMFAATLFVLFLSIFDFSASDVELWNGEISDKRATTQQCPYGWQRFQDGFCTEYRTREVYDGQTCTGSGKDRRCVSNYHTEYKYKFDWERRYFIYAENLKKSSWEVPRIDAQGTQAPPRFQSVKIGDPASIKNRYSNWVRAASDSIFHDDGNLEEKYKELIPEYPIEIYDFFKVDRIVTIGVTIPDIEKYNRRLSEALKQLGPKRQMNAVIVVVDASKIQNAEYAHAVRRAWKGFKKNDAVVFLGIKDNSIYWAEVLSWSKASIFDVELRDKILGDRDKPLDLNNVISYIENIGMKNYERRSMEEFEFLKEELRTPLWLIFLAVIANAIALFVTVIISRKENYSYAR
ncbi:hypothetical protein PHIN3_364 [Sinorhizobium phage phiN3]|uniref:Uncharacterized protein n=1 Tax=Sinorhizobium phage phiN3 TaxID=1647405 RepID=A0A0F6WCU4_9CAUD|nr:hypothetical protein AVT40_gp169 [Sinorhizobium phage phiN3]AKF13627.1 hypothetical protein PHIN3_364 [Sinorhizobium phage phiN3]